MTEKMLDEKVAEALGWYICHLRPPYDDLVWLGWTDQGEETKHTEKNVAGFFTQSISHCKKYIEPVLLQNGQGLLKKWNPYKELWVIENMDKPAFRFYGEGETEELAYCNALFNLKEKEWVK